MDDEPDPLWYDHEEPSEAWGRALLLDTARLFLELGAGFAVAALLYGLVRLA